MASAHTASSSSLNDIFNTLGVPEPTLLPDSTFYFLKDWGRGINLFFTFNSAKKAELETRFADEKLAELEKLAAEKPNEKNALDKAMQNYLDAKNDLQKRLEALKGQHNNIDPLLQKIADQTLEHEKLFTDLKDIVGEDNLKEATKEINDTAKKAMELNAEKFKEHLKDEIKKHEDDTEDLDALQNLTDESDDEDLNKNLLEIHDEIETEDASSTEHLDNIHEDFKQNMEDLQNEQENDSQDNNSNSQNED